MSSETHLRTHSIIFQDGEIAPPPTRYAEMESRISPVNSVTSQSQLSGLVNKENAIENGHRHSGFNH